MRQRLSALKASDMQAYLGILRDNTSTKLQQVWRGLSRGGGGRSSFRAGPPQWQIEVRRDALAAIAMASRPSQPAQAEGHWLSRVDGVHMTTHTLAHPGLYSVTLQRRAPPAAALAGSGGDGRVPALPGRQGHAHHGRRCPPLQQHASPLWRRQDGGACLCVAASCPPARVLLPLPHDCAAAGSCSPVPTWTAVLHASPRRLLVCWSQLSQLLRN
jgi:hypothetical protein